MVLGVCTVWLVNRITNETGVSLDRCARCDRVWHTQILLQTVCNYLGLPSFPLVKGCSTRITHMRAWHETGIFNYEYTAAVLDGKVIFVSSEIAIWKAEKECLRWFWFGTSTLQRWQAKSPLRCFVFCLSKAEKLSPMRRDLIRAQANDERTRRFTGNCLRGKVMEIGW